MTELFPSYFSGGKMRYIRAIRNTIVGWAASKEFALRREGKTGLAKILRWIK